MSYGCQIELFRVEFGIRADGNHGEWDRWYWLLFLHEWNCDQLFAPRHPNIQNVQSAPPDRHCNGQYPKQSLGPVSSSFREISNPVNAAVITKILDKSMHYALFKGFRPLWFGKIDYFAMIHFQKCLRPRWFRGKIDKVIRDDCQCHWWLITEQYHIHVLASDFFSELTIIRWLITSVCAR